MTLYSDGLQKFYSVPYERIIRMVKGVTKGRGDMSYFGDLVVNGSIN